jgi:hypothetical protein
MKTKMPVKAPTKPVKAPVKPGKGKPMPRGC